MTKSSSSSSSEETKGPSTRNRGVRRKGAYLADSSSEYYQGGTQLVKSSDYRGVTLFRPTEKWRAQISSKDNKTVSLGDWQTQEEAAEAYDRAAIQKFASSGRCSELKLNFHSSKYADEIELLRSMEFNDVVQMLRKHARKSQEPTSNYRGVSLLKQTQKWRAQINVGGKQETLGCFKTEIDAARAYDRVSIFKHKFEDSKQPEPVVNFNLLEMYKDVTEFVDELKPWQLVPLRNDPELRKQVIELIKDCRLTEARKVLRDSIPGGGAGHRPQGAKRGRGRPRRTEVRSLDDAAQGLVSSDGDNSAHRLGIKRPRSPVTCGLLKSELVSTPGASQAVKMEGAGMLAPEAALPLLPAGPQPQAMAAAPMRRGPGRPRGSSSSTARASVVPQAPPSPTHMSRNSGRPVRQTAKAAMAWMKGGIEMELGGLTPSKDEDPGIAMLNSFLQPEWGGGGAQSTPQMRMVSGEIPVPRSAPPPALPMASGGQHWPVHRPATLALPQESEHLPDVAEVSPIFGTLPLEAFYMMTGGQNAPPHQMEAEPAPPAPEHPPKKKRGRPRKYPRPEDKAAAAAAAAASSMMPTPILEPNTLQPLNGTRRAAAPEMLQPSHSLPGALTVGRGPPSLQQGSGPGSSRGFPAPTLTRSSSSCEVPSRNGTADRAGSLPPDMASHGGGGGSGKPRIVDGKGMGLELLDMPDDVVDDPSVWNILPGMCNLSDQGNLSPIAVLCPNRSWEVSPQGRLLRGRNGGAPAWQGMACDAPAPADAIQDASGGGRTTISMPPAGPPKPMGAEPWPALREGRGGDDQGLVLWSGREEHLCGQAAPLRNSWELSPGSAAEAGAPAAAAAAAAAPLHQDRASYTGGGGTSCTDSVAAGPGRSGFAGRTQMSGRQDDFVFGPESADDQHDAAVQDFLSASFRDDGFGGGFGITAAESDAALGRRSPAFGGLNLSDMHATVTGNCISDLGCYSGLYAVGGSQADDGWASMGAKHAQGATAQCVAGPARGSDCFSETHSAP